MQGRRRGLTITPAKNVTPPQVNLPSTPLPTQGPSNYRISRRHTTAQQPTKITDYQLVKVLGRGSYGTVYLGKSKRTDQICAVKVLEKRKIWLANCQETIAHEARIMRLVRRKPFVIQLIESFSNAKYLFMALELAELGDLSTLLEEFGYLSFSDMVYYLVQMSGGLTALHNAQIIYRDLKPENVLLTADGHVKLADFGLSKDVAQTDGRANTICGTILYMAPELILGKSYTYSVDWYSLGVVVHHLYTGKPPYRTTDLNGSRLDLMDTIVSGKVKPASCMDGDGKSFIFWLTHLDPQERPAHVTDLLKHPWVQHIPWVDILAKKVRAPHIMKNSHRVRPDSIDFKSTDHSSKFVPKDFEVDVFGKTFEKF